MSCLSWNYRGLENLHAVHALQCLILSKDHMVVFLCETKNNARYMERLRLKFNFDRSFTVDNRGNSGGLCVLWKEELNLNLRSYSQNHVDFDVGVPGDVQYWRLTGFYGYPTVSDHSKLWQIIDTLCGNAAHSWLCIRDFNEILQANEQEWGNSKSNRQMEGFRDIVDKC